MYLEFKWLFIHFVTQNVLKSHQIFINNRFIGIDILHRDGGRLYNYDFLDKNRAGKVQYDHDVIRNGRKYDHDIINFNNGRKQYGNVVNTPNTTTSITPTETTMIFVTISSITTKNATVSPSTLHSAVTLQVTPNNTTTSPKQADTEKTPLPKANTQRAMENTPLTKSLITIEANQTSNSTEKTQNSTSSPFGTQETLKRNEGVTKSITVVINGTNSTTVREEIPLNQTATTIGAGQNITVNETTTELHMTFPHPTTTAAPVTTMSPLMKEAMDDMKAMHIGYFSVFLINFLRIIARKDQQDLAVLIQAFQSEIAALDAANKLLVFGKSTRAAFYHFVQLINNLPLEVVQYYAKIGDYLLTNRGETLSQEIVNIIERIDDVFLEEEGKRVLHALEDLDKFPNGNKTAEEVVHEVADAAFVSPVVRVYGTPEEMSIVQSMDELVIKMVFSGYAIERRHNNNEFNNNTRIRNTSMYKTPYSLDTKKINKYKKRGKINTRKSTRKKYITAKTKRMSGKSKKKIIVKKKSLIKNNNIKTINKKIKPNKITQRNYKFIYLKLDNIGISKKTIKPSISRIKKQFKYHLNETTKTGKDKRKKPVNKDDISKRYAIKRKNAENNFKIHRFVEKREESSLTDEEEQLKANLDDAFFHGSEPVYRNREEIHREKEREGEKRTKYSYQSSNSDEEILLKSKIYKVLGYGNNLAEVVKKTKRKT